MDPDTECALALVVAQSQSGEENTDRRKMCQLSKGPRPFVVQLEATVSESQVT